MSLILLMQAMGKQRSDPVLVAFEKTLQNIITREAGEFLLITASEHDLTLTFNETDVLVKGEFTVKSSYGQQFIDQYCQALPIPITIDNVIQSLGTPHAIINHPHKLLEQKQLLFNKTPLWFSLKCQQNVLETIAILLSSMIPPNIQSNIFPVRTCKSKD